MQQATVNDVLNGLVSGFSPVIRQHKTFRRSEIPVSNKHWRVHLANQLFNVRTNGLEVLIVTLAGTTNHN